MTTFFEQRIDEKGLQFKVKTSSNVRDLIILDETRLKQNLINLVSHSIKFTKEGYVSLNFDCDFNSSSTSTINLKVRVEDTDIGIPKEEQKNIFAAFEQ